MSNFREKSLEEAKKVVEDLILENPKGKTFQFEAFIQGLSEEIESLWESGTKEAFAGFNLVEDGSLIYGGLEEKKIEGPTNIFIPVSFILEKHNPVTVKLAEEYLQLDIATKKNKLLDKLLGEGKSSENI